jgi:hydroxymethylpyrimidine/phosphomethylpyrimidine kinase
MGAQTVVIKGGHLKGSAVDLFYDGKKFTALNATRIRTKNTHGTGCTFSAAIAAYLAKGEQSDSAVALAKKFITRAIQLCLEAGNGRVAFATTSDTVKHSAER